MNENKKNENARDHMANERTFLAWIRTSIGIMAFGFVVVKFAFFVREITIEFGERNIVHSKGYSGIMGIFLVIVGSIITLLSFFQYKQTAKQLNEGTYSHSPILITMITSIIILVSLLLIVYLTKSI